MEGLTHGRISLSKFTAINADFLVDEIGGGSDATLSTFGSGFNLLF
jgi:hypothetical protein